MQKQIWYGIKGTGNNAKVRLFSQDPSSNQNVTGVGQCTLTDEGGDLDVIFPESGSSLFSETAHAQQTSETSSQTQA